MLTSPHALQLNHTPEGDGAEARSLYAILIGLPISVYDFIPEAQRAAIIAGTSTYDCTTDLQAAIAEADARGGAVIDFGPGTFCITGTLVVDSPGIVLRGVGAPGAATSKVAYRAGAKTTIKWTGAAGGTMYKLTSNAADDGSLGPVQGTAGIEGIFLDCRELAARGIEIRTWTYGLFAHVAVGYATQYGWLVTTLDNGVLSGAADTQHMEFRHCSYNEINTANGADAGWCIGKGAADDQGNVSLCSFYNIHSNVEGGGCAMSLENCDNLYFYFYRGQSRTGVGGTTILQAGDTGFLDQGIWEDGCRYCQFFAASGSFVAKAAVGGTADHSFGNTIWGLTRANGLPLPTVEAGAYLTCFESGGSGSTTPLGASITGRRRRGHLAALGGAIALANGVDTGVADFDSTYNTEGSLGTALAGITVPNGVRCCSIEAQASFAANATGYRQVTLLADGVAVSPSVFGKTNASNTGPTYVKAVAIELEVTPGAVLSLSALQTSGGALNLVAGDTWLRVRWH